MTFEGDVEVLLGAYEWVGAVRFTGEPRERVCEIVTGGTGDEGQGADPGTEEDAGESAGSDGCV